MFAPSPSPLSRLVLASAATISLVAVSGNTLAADAPAMLKKAEAACLDSAAGQGWRRDLAKVISSKALDADKVEVVFDLTKDGVNTARLTCPYSVSKGVGSAFTTRKAEVGAAPDSADATPGIPVYRGKVWWLLLPLALGLGSWLWLRRRNEVVGDAVASTGVTTTYEGETWYGAEAAAREGQVEVHEHADRSSRVVREVRNGGTFQITGLRRRDAGNDEWLEVRGGGWVRDAETRYDRNVVR